MPEASLESQVDSDIAAALSARAAQAWSAGSSDALARVMLAMSHAMRATAGKLPARRPHEFLDLLSKPIAEWLGGATDEVLLEAGQPSSYAMDLIAEGGSEPDAELVQQLVGDARASFATRADGEGEYRRFREFLVKHGTATKSEVLRALGPAGIALAKLFEPIAGIALVRRDTTQVFFPCPRCQWPMRCDESRVECSSRRCRDAGARFRSSEQELIPLANVAAPAAIPGEGRLQLHRAAWRYTLQPGLVEIDLAEQLRRISGTEVSLWPQRDLYDLDIRNSGGHWRIDVKDWSSAAALASRLQKRPPPAEVRIVVPDEHRAHLHVLSERVVSLRFQTVRELIHEVERAGRRAP